MDCLSRVLNGLSMKSPKWTVYEGSYNVNGLSMKGI